MKQVLGLILVCGWVVQAPAQDGPSPETLARFLEASRNPTGASLQELKSQVSSLNASLRDQSAGRIVPDLSQTVTKATRFGRTQYEFPTVEEKQRRMAETQQQINDLQDQISGLQSGRGIAAGLPLHNLRVGAMGTVADGRVQVIKIIDDRNWIGKLRRSIHRAEPSAGEAPPGRAPDHMPSSTSYVWFTNMPTSGLKEKSMLDCRQIFYVSGERKCSPTSGRPQMVFVLTPTMAALPAAGDKQFGDTLPPMP